MDKISSHPNGRKVVYTCVFDGYDTLIPPKVRDPGTDYICFTDNPNLPPNGWLIRSLDDVADGVEKGTRLSRAAKILPHRVLPQYETSVYVDANLEIHGTFAPLFEQLKTTPVAFFEHPEGRKDVYSEAAACIAHLKDDIERLQAHVERYRDVGFPGRSQKRANSIPAGMLILRRHNDQGVREAMELWWQEYVSGARRDQISLPYALWKSGIPHRLLPGNVRSNAFVQWFRHSTQQAARDLAQQYSSSSAIVLHLPGSGEDWISDLLARRERSRTYKHSAKGRGKAASRQILFDDNILGVACHGAPPLQVLHRELLLAKPVAILIGDPRWDLARSHQTAIARGAQLDSPADTAASKIYGKSRREEFQAMLKDFLAEHPGPTAVIDESYLTQWRFGTLRSWMSAIGQPLRTRGLLYKSLRARAKTLK